MSFDQRNDKTKSPQDQTVLSVYLLAAPALQSGAPQSRTGRVGAQVFILGMADMLRQVEDHDWETFVKNYRCVLANFDMLPSVSVNEFVGLVGNAASRDRDVERMMVEGAQSLRTFVADRDSTAPLDLSRAITYSEARDSIYEAIHGAP